MDSGWRAARRDTPRNGTGRAESAEPGRDPHLTRAHTDVRGAHTLKAGALACSRHRQRHRTERRTQTRIHTDRVGVGLSDERSVGRVRDVGGGRATSKAGRQAEAGRQQAGSSIRASARYYANGSACLPSARYGSVSLGRPH